MLNHFASKENVAAPAAELLGRQTQAARSKAVADDPLGAIQVLVGEYERAPRRLAIDALRAATDVYTWKLLRRDLRLSRADTVRILLDLVNGVLGRER